MENTHKIISWNVNGIRAAVNKEFYKTVERMDPDILCIQETKAQDDIVEGIAKEMSGYELYVNSAEKKGYSGTCVFSRIKPLCHAYGIGVDEHDKEGRVITLEFPGYYLVNAYVPNAGNKLVRLDYRKTWDRDLKEYLSGLNAKKPVLFTGDLNVAHEPIDLARPKPNYNKTAGYTQDEIDGFKSILGTGLIDTFRHFYKDRVQYTFWNMRFRGREKNIGWRIDYFLAAEGLMGKVKDSFVLDDVMGSDHCPVGVILEA